jgi:glycosyltransferase involved in cell wall biosynthesis
MVVYTDTSFSGWLEYCQMFSPLSQRSVRYGEQQEKQALERCTKIIYSSQWGKQVACRAYGLDENKVEVVPFGANLVCARTEEEMEQIYRHRWEQAEKKLLFVGYNWRNKGGQTALEATKELNHRGIQAKLLIVGCTPDIDSENQKYVEIYGFLDKNVESDRKKLEELYQEANLFILPTRYDCSPIVSAEACSFGLPSLITDTCGVSNMMIHGQTGKLMPYEATGADYAEQFTEILSDERTYVDWCRGARRGYEEVFNWKQVGEKIQKVLEELI